MRKVLMSWFLASAARWHQERGQTMAEYALILVLVALVVIGALTTVGTTLIAAFQRVVGVFP